MCVRYSEAWRLAVEILVLHFLPKLEDVDAYVEVKGKVVPVLN
jgi:hypothetical protein